MNIPVITLTLLHPTQSNPIQSWIFDAQPTIYIGRAQDNDVVLYSAVVSRHHLEIRHNSEQWEVINHGANGAYLDGQPITQVTLDNDMIICLGESGPRILIQQNSVDPKNLGKIATPSRSNSSANETIHRQTFITNPAQTE